MDFVFLLFLIIINGVFASSELAVSLSKRIRLQAAADSGSSGAKAAMELADNPTKFLSIVQIGLTGIGISSGVIAEGTVGERLTHLLTAIPMLGDYAGKVSTGLVVVILTYLTIVLGELVPKRMALMYPEAVAVKISVPLLWLARIMSPIVRVLAITTAGIMRVIGLKQPQEQAVTEEEITGILKEGAEAGVFEQTEHEIVTRALRLDDVRLAALMTPRADIVFIDLAVDIAESLKIIGASPFSRFPVYLESRSNIQGIIHGGDLFAQAIEGQSMRSVDITKAMKPALFVPESVSAMDLLETLKKNRAEVALVIDEYGEVQGMVTLSDVMGALVGDVTVVDGGPEEADAVQREDGSWLVDGGISLDRFREIFNVDVSFPEEEGGSYLTIAGFVLSVLCHIPKVSEHFEWANFRFEVVDMDRHRIDRLLISQLVVEPTEA